MALINTVGLILAAGYSSRMGTFKPLLPIGDMTAIERVSDTLKKAGIHNVIGVTGFQRERLSSIFASEGILEAYNPDFEQGMFTSVKTGIAKAMAELSPEGFFLMLVDCPLVPPEVLERILKKHEENPDAFIVPCFRGKKGHPLFIPVQYAEEILAYEGEGGLKAITNRHEDKLVRLEVGTEGVVLDMDTPEGYREVLECYQKQAEEPDCEEMLHGKRIFFIRHGEIRQHKEKIFLGQTDIPLSARGREQAAEAAEEIKRYGISANRIYTSDLSRASETAEIIKDSLNQYYRKQELPEKAIRDIEMIKMPKLREMSLGEWDGRYIGEIREKYPEEYQKRGANLLTYKLGNDSENFYDLQYRAMKGFQNILEQELEAEDNGKDIVIVSHLGIINVILSNLRHTDLEDEIGNRIPNGGVIVIDYSK